MTDSEYEDNISELEEREQMLQEVMTKITSLISLVYLSTASWLTLKNTLE